MDQPQSPDSEPILVLGAPAEKQPIRIHMTRIPFDQFFHLEYVKDGKDVSEELEAAETKQWFKDHGVTNMDALEKCLDECWNFYETYVSIPAAVWREPKRPFEKFQPNV